MTRRFLPALAGSVLVVAGACSQQADPEARSTPAATPTPMPQIVVSVQVPEEATPDVEAWAEELRAAVTAGHGDLDLAASPGDAQVIVRIDSVESRVKVDPEPEGEGETSLMRGALVLGESARGFQLVYKGEVRPQAEALARNLRGYAAETDAPVPESDAEPADTPEPEADTEE